MLLHNLLDISLLKRHLLEGAIIARRHPQLPLSIYNYSAKAQFENIWDGATCLCRGLIVDDGGVVVARPFRKFFNLNTEWWPESRIENLPSVLPEITTKLDGSLIIGFQYDGTFGLASRGSFESEQALWSAKWYADNISY